MLNNDKKFQFFKKTKNTTNSTKMIFQFSFYLQINNN